MRQEPAGNVRMFQPLERVQGRQAQHDGLSASKESSSMVSTDARSPNSESRCNMSARFSVEAALSWIIFRPRANAEGLPNLLTESHRSLDGNRLEMSAMASSGRNQRFYP